jgi:hypothetical protein
VVAAFVGGNIIDCSLSCAAVELSCLELGLALSPPGGMLDSTSALIYAKILQLSIQTQNRELKSLDLEPAEKIWSSLRRLQ